MHPVLAQILAAQQQQMQAQPPTPAEQALIAHLEFLEGQAIMVERMCAAVDRTHGASVRDDLSVEEIHAFTSTWSEGVLDTCLRAGVTSWEVRKALRTGVLPDKGIVESLAGIRNPQ